MFNVSALLLDDVLLKCVVTEVDEVFMYKAYQKCAKFWATL